MAVVEQRGHQERTCPRLDCGCPCVLELVVVVAAAAVGGWSAPGGLRQGAVVKLATPCAAECSAARAGRLAGGRGQASVVESATGLR